MTLPPLAEAQEKPLKIDPSEVVILQPKFDGCQAILRNTTSGYHAYTRKGQVIVRLEEQCRQLDRAGLTKVYFAEYMPRPWSEEGKHKLVGNLYNQDPLPFATQLMVFDCMDPVEFSLGKMKQLPCRERLLALDADKEALASANLQVSPWQEMSYADAKQICQSSRIPTPEGTRCRILGELVEGGIIRAGSRIEKDKAKQDMDVSILQAVTTAKGQRGWIAVDTKRPSAEGLMIIYGGVTPQNHQALVGKVVEVDILTVSGVEGGGNPTFRRDRSNEKHFDGETFCQQHAQELAAFARRYGVGAPEIAMTIG